MMKTILLAVSVPDSVEFMGPQAMQDGFRKKGIEATVSEVDLSAEELSRISQMHNAVSPERRTLREAAAQMRGEQD